MENISGISFFRAHNKYRKSASLTSDCFTSVLKITYHGTCLSVLSKRMYTQNPSSFQHHILVELGIKFERKIELLRLQLLVSRIRTNFDVEFDLEVNVDVVTRLFCQILCQIRTQCRSYRKSHSFEHRQRVNIHFGCVSKANYCQYSGFNVLYSCQRVKPNMRKWLEGISHQHPPLVPLFST